MVGSSAGQGSGAGQSGRPQGPPGGVFRSGVELVTGSRDGARPAQAGARPPLADFQVVRPGPGEPSPSFRTEAAPVSVAILFDVSGSMDRGRPGRCSRSSAPVLSWSEQPPRRGRVFALTAAADEVAPLRSIRAPLKALAEVDPFGATSLHDAIAATAKRISERANRRRAIIVLTDGIDTASRLTPADVSGIASEIDVPVYVVAVVLPIDNPDANGRPSDVNDVPVTVGHPRTRGVDGGELFYASTPSDTSKVARQIVRELRQQYLIAFAPSAGAGCTRSKSGRRRRT